MKGCLIAVLIGTIILGCICGAAEWLIEMLAGAPRDFYICLGLLAFIILCIIVLKS